MELTNGTFFQMLLRRRNIVALRKIIVDLLANPTARENLGLGVTEAPLQIGNCSRVGALLT